MPVAALDGPWYLSHTFSILNGNFYQSNFAHEFMTIYNLPYGYGFINVPLYYFFVHTWANVYSIFLINALEVFLLIFLLVKLWIKYGKNNSFLFTFFIFALLSSFATYLQRPELVCLILVIGMHLLLAGNSRDKNFNVYFSAVLLSVIYQIHPFGGIYATAFLTFFFVENKYSFSRWFKICAVAAVMSIILYLPVLFKSLNGMNENLYKTFFVKEDREMTFGNAVKFLWYVIPFIPIFILYFFHIEKRKLIVELIIWVVMITLLVPFGRYYYYFYLLHFLAWRIVKLPPVKLIFIEKGLIIVFSIIGFYTSFLFPAYQISENAAYANTFKDIVFSERKIALHNPKVKVWVTPYTGMAVIDLPNGRLFHDHYIQSAGSKPVLNNDIFLVGSPRYIPKVKEFATEQDTVIVQQIVPEVKGLKRFISGRSDSLGLWKIVIQKR